MIYSGDQFPWWKGSAFSGGMVGEQLTRVSLEAGGTAVSEETLLGGVLGRIREVKQGPDGFIYLTSDNREGDRLSKIFRLEPVAGEVQPPASLFLSPGHLPSHHWLRLLGDISMKPISCVVAIAILFQGSALAQTWLKEVEATGRPRRPGKRASESMPKAS